MDTKALYSLSYGVFMLATESNGRVNGCITNTCMQVASNPTRVAISCLNTNLTCDLIKESGVFNLSILDDTCAFETIQYFGMQSGKNVDKFGNMEFPKAENGIPYLAWHTCAVLCCHVAESYDLGSHTLFVAELDDAFRVSENPPLTYADYQANLKPKPQKAQPAKEIVGWKCKICGYVYEGAQLPADFLCPLCGHDAGDFEPIFKE